MCLSIFLRFFHFPPPAPSSPEPLIVAMVIVSACLVGWNPVPLPLFCVSGSPFTCPGSPTSYGSGGAKPRRGGLSFCRSVGPEVSVMVWITVAGPLSNVIAIRSNPGDRKPGWRFYRYSYIMKLLKSLLQKVPELARTRWQHFRRAENIKRRRTLRKRNRNWNLEFNSKNEK